MGLAARRAYRVRISSSAERNKQLERTVLAQDFAELVDGVTQVLAQLPAYDQIESIEFIDQAYVVTP